VDGDDGVLTVDFGTAGFANSTRVLEIVAHAEVAPMSEIGKLHPDICEVLRTELADSLVAGVLSGIIDEFRSALGSFRHFDVDIFPEQEGIRPVQRLWSVEQPRCQDCWTSEDLIVVDVTQELRFPEEGVDGGLTLFSRGRGGLYRGVRRHLYCLWMASVVMGVWIQNSWVAMTLVAI
jgi:hypothetical protein